MFDSSNSINYITKLTRMIVCLNTSIYMRNNIFQKSKANYIFHTKRITSSLYIFLHKFKKAIKTNLLENSMHDTLIFVDLDVNHYI